MELGRYSQIAVWLLLCCALVFAMVVLGGVTRLTQSGLSMVEWDPIMGVLPPLNLIEWQDVFVKYQASPEYQLVNKGMTLDAFKGIFYIEYAHRMLGRLIGIVFIVPMLWFLITGRIRRELLPKLLLALLLGSMQGVLGWYMVKSGLVHQPHVSPYRLSAHLGLAVLIYGFMLWIALDILSPVRKEPADYNVSTMVRVLGWSAISVVGLMILSGGFVAGTKAGFTFNSFPKMFGHWIPDGMWALQPVWRNLFENVATVQFTHRCLALVVFGVVSWLWIASRGHMQPGVQQWARNILPLVLGIQIILGILTLLYIVPVSLAAAHQAGALLLLTVLVLVVHPLSNHRAGMVRRMDWADT